MYRVQKSITNTVENSSKWCSVTKYVILVIVFFLSAGLLAYAEEGISGDRVIIKKKDFPSNIQIQSISVSPDGENVAIATEKSVFIASLSHPGSLRNIYDKGTQISEIKYSNTGKALAVMDGRKSGYYNFDRKKMVIAPIDYFYNEPCRLFFSDYDAYFIVSAATKKSGYEILFFDTLNGKLCKRFNLIPPEDVKCIEKKKTSLAIRNYKLSIFDMQSNKIIYKEKIDCSPKTLPSFNGQKGYYGLCTPDINHILIFGDGTLLKRDLYGKCKPIIGKIDKRNYNFQVKEINGCQVIAISGFRKLDDEKGYVRLYDYDKMQYISDEIPIEKVYDIAPSYKFLVYMWNGELRMKNLSKHIR